MSVEKADKDSIESMMKEENKIKEEKEDDSDLSDSPLLHPKDKKTAVEWWYSTIYDACRDPDYNKYPDIKKVSDRILDIALDLRLKKGKR